MKYLNNSELEKLTDEELKLYTDFMVTEQNRILDLMDLWVDSYNDISDEYNKRKSMTKYKLIVIKNDSDTRH